MTKEILTAYAWQMKFREDEYKQIQRSAIKYTSFCSIQQANKKMNLFTFATSKSIASARAANQFCVIINEFPSIESSRANRLILMSKPGKKQC